MEKFYVLLCHTVQNEEEGEGRENRNLLSFSCLKREEEEVIFSLFR